jgi:hypothetical protein
MNLLDEFPDPTPADPKAPSAAEAPTADAGFVRCWQCLRDSLITPATTVNTLGPTRPLCGSHRRVYQGVIDDELATATCTTCHAVGVASLTGEGVGLCSQHEPAEKREARVAQAGQDVADSLGDWHLSMAEEIGVLISRLAEVAVAAKQKDLEAGLGTSTVNHSTLSDALRLAWEEASMRQVRKGRWCEGWAAWCRGEPAPTDAVRARGWTAAATLMPDASTEERALAAGEAPMVYESLGKQDAPLAHPAKGYRPCVCRRTRRS